MAEDPGQPAGARVRAAELILARADPEPQHLDVALTAGPRHDEHSVEAFLADLTRAGARLTAPLDAELDSEPTPAQVLLDDPFGRPYWFHCPPEHLDAIYGSARYPMGS